MTDINDKSVKYKVSAMALPWWQKRTFKITIALIGLIVILVVMTLSVAKNETHLANGDTVLLELAPVDPRGFMQGDYMTLSYALENEVFAVLEKNTDDSSRNARNIVLDDGYAIVTIDKNNVGRFARLAGDRADNLASNEIAIYYRIRNGTMKLATNAFFFQEGHAEAFEAAEYGLFRVNDKGEPLLTDMVDSEFKVIKGINTKSEDAIGEAIENRGRQGSGM